MGGLGSGGTRAGAGEKPHQDQGDSLPDPVQVPADLPADQVVVWEGLAPHAREMKTLTAGTADAFRDLCELIVWRRKLLETIEKDGLTHVKVSVDGAGVEHQELKRHPLLGEYRGLMQRVEAGRARFRLAPMGKEIVSKKKDKPKSALDALKASAHLRAV